MNPRPVHVESIGATRLSVTFSNGEKRIFDASPYLSYPAFESLREPGYFALCQAKHGTVTWPDGTDFCPDTVYLESVPHGT